MDSSIMEEEESEKRVRSFRYEDYNNRRVFLRSYPLNWDDEEVIDDEHADATTQGMLKVSKAGKVNVLKERVLYVLRWSEGKVFLLKRKLKHKVAFYLVACHSFGFKPSPSLLSV
uniref:Uncharacterized protein n=1 Tax=Nelumbo nucifera TaxID=4432 RepID=A0A822ZNE5_NELNU|nr:TPA_asm: hypothetical protein HUJ06_016364 [Nelumbo nucifera]